MSLLLPVPADACPRRLIQLYAGLALYGFSSALLVEAALGLDPWDVLHQGLSRQTGASIGTCTIPIGVCGPSTLDTAAAAPGSRDGEQRHPHRAGGGWVSRVAPRASEPPVAMGIPSLRNRPERSGHRRLHRSRTRPRPPRRADDRIAGRGHSIRVVRTGLEVVVLGAGWALGGRSDRHDRLRVGHRPPSSRLHTRVPRSGGRDRRCLPTRTPASPDHSVRRRRALSSRSARAISNDSSTVGAVPPRCVGSHQRSSAPRGSSGYEAEAR